MSVMMFALRELMISEQMADIEFRLGQIGMHRQLLAQKTASLTYEQLENARSYISNSEDTEAEGVDNVSVRMSPEFQQEYEFEMSQIQAKELVWDQEKTQLEVKYKALSTEAEDCKKAKHKSIEKSFGYMGGSSE